MDRKSSDMKITFGLTTYNRKNHLEKSITSLIQIKDINKHHIRIYDDFSTEYGIDYLKSIVPSATEIIRREKNLGADFNMATMYRDFLTTGDDILVCCDSDLIYNPNLISIIKDNLDFTDGVLSLYNSILHSPTDELLINNFHLVRKKSIGCAGAIFRRNIIQKIVNNVPISLSYDWRWCEYLHNTNIRILCTYNSYIQHIGMEGVNHNILKRKLDLGLNFIAGNDYNTTIMTEMMEYMSSARKNRVIKYVFYKLKVKISKLAKSIAERLKRLRSSAKS